MLGADGNSAGASNPRTPAPAPRRSNVSATEDYYSPRTALDVIPAPVPVQRLRSEDRSARDSAGPASSAFATARDQRSSMGSASLARAEEQGEQDDVPLSAAELDMVRELQSANSGGALVPLAAVATPLRSNGVADTMYESFRRSMGTDAGEQEQTSNVPVIEASSLLKGNFMTICDLKFLRSLTFCLNCRLISCHRSYPDCYLVTIIH